MLLLRFFSIFTVFLCSSLYAQQQGGLKKSEGSKSLISDSVQSKYGPATTKWTTEANLFNNKQSYQTLDTSINKYDRWTYIERLNNNYQDLGVVGTALNPIFALTPSVIGASSGFKVYEPYLDSEEPHYFDTQSPFSRMKIIWGGKGRASTNVSFSRNINPRWNFGFNYRPLLVVKQIQSRGKTDLQTKSHYYDGYTTFKSKNEKYFLLFNFRRIRHKVKENGGVGVDSVELNPDLFNPNDTPPTLTAAQSEWYYRNIHLLHHYELSEAFQVYHKSDFTKQTNGYTDDLTVEPKLYYPYKFHIDSLQKNNVSDNTTNHTVEQEIGVKGNVGKFFFSSYYKFREFNFSNDYLKYIGMELTRRDAENYLGGSVFWYPDSVSEISLEAQSLLSGYYKINGKIQTKWVEGYIHNSRSKPGNIQSTYRGNNVQWSNRFFGINTFQVKGFAKAKFGLQQFWAGGTFTRISNLIYFREKESTEEDKQKVKPYQSPATQVIFSPEVKFSIRFAKYFNFSTQFIYTIVNDDSIIRIPSFFANSQLSYENELFKKRIKINAGFEFHWKSSYKALGYYPVVQQFYIQDGFISPSYYMLDCFLNGKIRRTRFFFKYHNLIQAFTQIGFIPTPIYPEQRNVLDFGFEFILFD